MDSVSRQPQSVNGAMLWFAFYSLQKKERSCYYDPARVSFTTTSQCFVYGNMSTGWIFCTL